MLASGGVDEALVRLTLRSVCGLKTQRSYTILSDLVSELAGGAATAGGGLGAAAAPMGQTVTAAAVGSPAKPIATPAVKKPAAPAPVETVEPAPLATAPAWSLKKPIRFQGYGKPLYDFLKAAHAAGKPCPKGRDLLDAWKTKRPLDVVEVTDNGLKYYDAKGSTKPADLEAIRKAIGRMTQ